MFLKLLKWDLKSQRKIFILYIIYAVSILNLVLVDLINVDWLAAIAVAFNFMIAMLVIALPIILLAISYAQDFYGNNSYTMHQLAVKTSTIFHAKMLSGAIYLVLSFIVFAIGTFITNAVIFEFLTVERMINALGKAFSEFAKIPSYIENMNSFTFWLIVLFFFIFALIGTQIYYAFIVTFGNSRFLRRFGKAGIVLSFLAVYIGTQIVSFLTLIYMPMSIVVEKTSGMMVRLSLTTDRFVDVVPIFGYSQNAPIPLGTILTSILLTILAYIYVVNQLNNRKSIG